MWYLVYFRAAKPIITLWFSHILPLIILVGCSTAEHWSSAVWLRLNDPFWLILNFVSMSCMFAIRKSAVRIVICTHILGIHVYCLFLKIWLNVVIQIGKNLKEMYELYSSLHLPIYLCNTIYDNHCKLILRHFFSSQMGT